MVEEFCPKVEVLRPGACAISVRGPARYFGGESELVRKIAAAVRAAGFAGQVGVADGLFAAELAATLGPDGRLRTGRPHRAARPDGGVPRCQPVSALGRPELSYLLPRLGITTLGEFAALPAAEAANRFGVSGELAHRLARGLDPRPLVPRPPAADLSVRCEFDPPAEQSEPVVFAAKSLAEDLHARLAASGLACVRIEVQVHCEDGREISRFWRHDGLLSGLAVAERVRWQLDGWRPQAGAPGDEGPADGGGPVGGITLLRLIPDQLVRDTGRQLRPLGRRRGQRPGSPRGHPRPGHARARRGDAPGAGRRPSAGRPGAARPLRGRRRAAAPGGPPVAGADPRPRARDRLPGAAAGLGHRRRRDVGVGHRPRPAVRPARLAVRARPAGRAITSWAGPWPVSENWWDPDPRAGKPGSSW